MNELLNKNYNKIKQERGWTSHSRIMGEAVEMCVITLPCPVCDQKYLLKCKTNARAKDAFCENCDAQIQIKATKRKIQAPLQLLGAEYKTTLDSIKENKINYIVVFYSEKSNIFTINNILFVNTEDINESCVIPRKPLSPHARRAGWQGCKLVFHKYKTINTY